MAFIHQSIFKLEHFRGIQKCSKNDFRPLSIKPTSRRSRYPVLVGIVSSGGDAQGLVIQAFTQTSHGFRHHGLGSIKFICVLPYSVEPEILGDALTKAKPTSPQPWLLVVKHGICLLFSHMNSLNCSLTRVTMHSGGLTQF